MADIMGVLYSRKNGLFGNLLFGHGFQKNFNIWLLIIIYLIITYSY